MKNSHRCPKCTSTDIARFKGGAGSYGTGNCLLVDESWLFPTIVKVSRYVCRGCGFVEEWIDSDLELKKVRKAKTAAK